MSFKVTQSWSDEEPQVGAALDTKYQQQIPDEKTPDVSSDETDETDDEFYDDEGDEALCDPVIRKMVKEKMKENKELMRQAELEALSLRKPPQEVEIDEIEPLEERLTPLEEALDMTLPANVLISGRTNTGKTKMLSALLMRLCHEEQVDRIVVLLGAQDPKSDDYSFVPKKWIFTEPSIKHVEEVFRQQKEEFKGMRTICVLDDCMGIINFKRTAVTKGKDGNDKINVFTAIAAASRKYNLSLFIVTQNMSNAISVPLRDSCQSIFTPKVMAGDLECVFKSTSSFERLGEFRQFNNTLKEYEFLRINRAAGSKPHLIFKSIKVPKWKWDA